MEKPPKFEIDVKNFAELGKVDSNPQRTSISGGKADEVGGLMIVKCNICGIKVSYEFPPHVEFGEIILTCPRCKW